MCPGMESVCVVVCVIMGMVVCVVVCVTVVYGGCVCVCDLTCWPQPVDNQRCGRRGPCGSH